jgi:S1-C subfamily serine protease
MSRLLCRAVLAAGLLTLVLPAAARDEKPKRVEIGKRAKAATAFVDVPGLGTGTAFCVHPSGLFVTNEHVVRGAQNDTVTLVLDPSLETQRVFKAKVVRADKGTDLALLRAEGAKDLPSLTLGSTAGRSSRCARRTAYCSSSRSTCRSPTATPAARYSTTPAR